MILLEIDLITEQCWSGTSALLGNQSHKNEFISILLNEFHFGRPQLLIVRENIGDRWKESISWLSNNSWFNLIMPQVLAK